jgi:hypothetical protein
VFLWTPLDGARFKTVGPIAHAMAGDRRQDLLVEAGMLASPRLFDERPVRLTPVDGNRKSGEGQFEPPGCVFGESGVLDQKNPELRQLPERVEAPVSDSSELKGSGILKWRLVAELHKLHHAVIGDNKYSRPAL